MNIGPEQYFRSALLGYAFALDEVNDLTRSKLLPDGGIDWNSAEVVDFSELSDDDYDAYDEIFTFLLDNAE